MLTDVHALESRARVIAAFRAGTLAVERFSPLALRGESA
jgi:hypothetical protein